VRSPSLLGLPDSGLLLGGVHVGWTQDINPHCSASIR
jgi:hypothetical protein